ncbi:MAG: 5'/3'-nucleotidase SurE [Candidatus Cloacimonadales bacterium]|jgi:5'-nucleotidase|nr:5'/3'-nucleotidase SurE [Candidatus Cloacimonadota bacterium]MDD2649659.1 5'/3'-nucleotidase SurE [Candidatus Cloacimonadota bacterium]MDD3501168.1 5'/3'-nucleotidase SurE [Candidatus Cloacimonadota bacterium]MDX9976936.1 5'/3'-nucleotidase SurE [Candidatus Cloacimonadales bacterium]
MNILICNDDGIHSNGIITLVNTFKSKGHKVFLVAPASEKSAQSHAITIREALRVKQYDENSWSVSGSPVDSVLIALEHLLHEKKIDLVISGINAGQNIGDDVLYSGTVAVAVEAMCLGFKAIAISITSYEDQFFETASTIIDKLVDLQIYDLIGHRQLININVPNLPLSEIKGLRICKTGFRRYQNIVHQDKDHRNRDIFWIGGDSPIWEEYNENIDGYLVKNAIVAISPLKVDYNDYQMHKTYIDFLEKNKEQLNFWHS